MTKSQKYTATIVFGLLTIGLITYINVNKKEKNFISTKDRLAGSIIIGGIRYENGKGVESFANPGDKGCNGPIPNNCISSVNFSSTEGDLNGDGQTDAILSINSCGATCGPYPMALIQKKGDFIEVPISIDYQGLGPKPYASDFSIFNSGFDFNIRSYLTGELLKSGLRMIYNTSTEKFTQLKVTQ